MSAVVIHALGARLGGAERHLTNFLPALVREDPARRYVVLVPQSFPAPAVSGNVEVRRVPDRVAAGWVARPLHDVLRLPRQLARDHVAAIVSLTNFGPVWSPVPHILFQRNAIYYCDEYHDRIGPALRIETALRRRLALESMKRADMIVTPSRSMAAMIRRRHPELDERRFETLYHGFALDSLAGPVEPGSAIRLEGGDRVRLLYPTHAAPHKGFDVLFAILARLKAGGTSFRLFATVGVSDWPAGVRGYERTVRALGLEDDVAFLGRVPQREMGALYERCDLMVYPSLCESFGFSMIEAMGHGLPIVAAKTGINEEICRDAALYYPPSDSVAGAQAIVDALRPETRSRLKGAAAARVAGFDWSWTRYAREFVALVERVT